MRIIERYFSKQFASAFMGTITAFVIFYLAFDLLSRINLIIEGEIPAGRVFEYYLSMTPIVFVQVCPVAVLLATMFTLSNMSRHNELIAAVGCGKHPYAVFAVFLAGGLLISLASLAVHEKTVPGAAERAHAIRFRSMGDAGEEILKNRFIYGAENRRFFVERLDLSDNTFTIFEISEFSRAGSLALTFRSTGGAYLKGAWLFENVMLRSYGEEGEELASIHARKAEAGSRGWTFFSGFRASGGPGAVEFDVYKPGISGIIETPEDFAAYRLRYNEMNFSRLREHIDRLRSAGFHPRPEIIALHSKLSLPLANIVLMLIGISFSAKQKKGGLMLGLGAALGFTLVYYILMNTGSLLGEVLIPPAAGAWLANAVFLFPGVYFTLKARHL